MSIQCETVRYGDQVAFFAAPERHRESLPAVIVVQEVFGLGGHIEDVARRIAAAGYAAIAPDLYAVDGVRPPHMTSARIERAFGVTRSLAPELAEDPVAKAAALARLPDGDAIAETEAGIQAAFAGMAGFTASLRKAFRYVVGERPETKGQKVACVGFCMGGGLSALLACEEEGLSGAAIYYGMPPDPGAAVSIRCPVIGFYGAEDGRVNAGLPAFEAALAVAKASFEKRMYPGAGHGFFCDDRPSYHEGAARDSYWRLLQFFSRVLSG
jgi:Dienelactone hydrolase and related enzymes